MDRVPTFIVVLPTYNERENLEPFVRALMDVFERCGLNGDVIIVDDNSPDGTGTIADRLADELGSVSVIHRSQKEGIGPAYVAGFKQALTVGTSYIFEMDCDFSHDPENVPLMLEAARDADLVLGSRYVPGGRVENWGALRRFISRGGGIYAKWILGIPVNDLTGGNKCFRREVLEALDLDAVASSGYGFQIELTFKTTQLGFRVKEVPITFRDRRLGESKMSRRIVLEAALMVWRLKWGQIKRRRRERPAG